MPTRGLSLVGFLDPAAALAHLRNACVPAAGATDASLLADWQQAKQRLGAPPVRNPGTPRTTPLPAEAAAYATQLQELRWVNEIMHLFGATAQFMMVEVDALLSKKHLQRVPANSELAHVYLQQARAHLQVSVANTDQDPIGSFQLAYDAARKALASLLLVQGLRPTSTGGHIAVYDAVMAQFGRGMGDVIRPFSSMRRLRNSSEYPRSMLRSRTVTMPCSRRFRRRRCSKLQHA